MRGCFNLTTCVNLKCLAGHHRHRERVGPSVAAWPASAACGVFAARPPLAAGHPQRRAEAKCGAVGLRLQQELQGRVCLPMDLALSHKQETCVSHTFSRPVTNAPELREAVATYVSRAVDKATPAAAAGRGAHRVRLH